MNDWALILDRIEAGVTPASELRNDLLYRAYSIGYRKAETSCDLLRAEFEARLRQAQWDADRFYERWRNPGRKLSAVQRRRIDETMLGLDRAGMLITAELQFIATLEAALPPQRTAA